MSRTKRIKAEYRVTATAVYPLDFTGRKYRSYLCEDHMNERTNCNTSSDYNVEEYSGRAVCEVCEED